VCSGRNDAALWLHRARMMFLALAGRPSAVRLLVEKGHARHMSPAARTYWMAVAHEHHGDRDAATAAYEQARGRSRGRPRALIEQAIEKLPSAAPVQLSPEANQVVALVEAAPLPAAVRMPRPHRPWATWGLTASLLGVAAVIAFAIGPSSDPGVLLRAGALVRGRVDAGEWWRVVSCVFIHVGTVHLAVNAIGMFFLGRIAEELYGSPRTLAIFGLAGLAGALASYLGSPVGVSAGASGAIFGVLGAVFIELTLYRERYRAAWKRGMWGGLVVITLAQAGIGFLYPVIDQWAHGAGLLAGIVFGALLSPSVRWSKLARHAGSVLALGFAGIAVTAAVMVARTSLADSLDGTQVRHVIGDIAVTAPATWIDSPELADPDGVVIVTVKRVPVTNATVQIAGWMAGVDRLAKERGFDTVEHAPDRVIALPSGWEGSEVIASFEDGMEFRQRYRLVAAGRVFQDSLIVVLIYAPDTVMCAAPGVFVQLLASLGPA